MKLRHCRCGTKIGRNERRFLRDYCALPTYVPVATRGFTRWSEAAYGDGRQRPNRMTLPNQCFRPIENVISIEERTQ